MLNTLIQKTLGEKVRIFLGKNSQANNLTLSLTAHILVKKEEANAGRGE